MEGRVEHGDVRDGGSTFLAARIPWRFRRVVERSKGGEFFDGRLHVGIDDRRSMNRSPPCTTRWPTAFTSSRLPITPSVDEVSNSSHAPDRGGVILAFEAVFHLAFSGFLLDE